MTVSWSTCLATSAGELAMLAISHTAVMSLDMSNSNCHAITATAIEWKDNDSETLVDNL